MDSYAISFASELELRFGGKNANYIFEVIPGRKFDKIVRRLTGSERTSVHAFVERSTGALIKAASWSQPQKDTQGRLAIRYNLADEQEYKRAVESADEFGSYLYAR